MAIGDDFSIAANGDIRYTGTTTNYTVIALHRWLQDLADDAVASGDDIMDITKTTPSSRSTDNIIELLAPYNVDDAAIEHLYDGSIIQSGGDEIYDGIVVFAPQGTYLQVIQNGALVAPNFWTNGLNPDATAGISHRFMVKVRTGGADIDLRKLLGTTRELGNSYDEFPINATARGNNVIALATAQDLNNQTLEATIAGWTDIGNTEGYRQLDVNGDSTPEPYYSEWDRASRTINQLYERTKWLTRRGTVSTLYGLSGEVFRGPTHEVDLTTPRSGTFNAFEPVSWTGGTGQMLAIDSTTAGTKMWIQLLTGVPPSGSDLITGGTSTATATNTGTPTERTISPEFLGQSTGTAVIGAYGVGIEPADLSAADLLRDLTDQTRQPPNNVTFTVLGLVSGEDRVLVGPESGGNLETNQLASSTGNNVSDPDFVVQSAIPSDTPSSGTFRVTNGNSFDLYQYSSFSGSTFTLDAGAHPGGLDRTYTNGDDVFISYIDKLAAATQESFTVVYNADRPLFIRVRDGGVTPIKTFETTGTLGTGGGSATAIRTTDE